MRTIRSLTVSDSNQLGGATPQIQTPLDADPPGRRHPTSGCRPPRMQTPMDEDTPVWMQTPLSGCRSPGCRYRHRHAHKHLCMVLPLYSKIEVLCGITSCRLMNDNNQQVDLTCLLRMTWPKDVIDKWNNSDLKDAILTIRKKNPEFYLSPVSIWMNILQSNKHTHSP